MKKKTASTTLVALGIALAPVLLCGCQQEQAVDIPHETLTYVTVGGCELQADIYRSPGDEIRPAILWLHPGGLITLSRDWISSAQAQMYLEAGYVVVAIDHRLAPETNLEAILEDLQSAYLWMRGEGGEAHNIDPDRIAVVGHSAGGYLALASGYLLDPAPKAIVSFYGYGDISGAWYSEPSPYYSQREPVSEQAANVAILSDGIPPCGLNTDEIDMRFSFYVRTRQLGTWPEEVAGRDPDVDLDWFAAYEPVQNVSAEYPPTLLLHGEADEDVPFQQSIAMAAEFESFGVEYDLISNARWGHIFDERVAGEVDVEEALRQVIEFLDAHLR
jgi:acetyl esterase/lipase